MENYLELFSKINSWVWGPPLLILLMGTGLMLTVKLGLLQVLKLPLALKLIFKNNKEEEGDVSSFGALCTALAATVGTGNIVGVATAVTAGGPGAIFWMWVAAFLGMATKYAEGVLAISYRTTDEKGQMAGGPMYYIEKGVGSKFLAVLFAVFGVLVAFIGIGTFPQVNAIASATKLTFGISEQITAIILAVLVALVTLGGIRSISKVSEKIVPFMSAFYIIGCLIIVFKNISILPETISLIFTTAFTGKAVGGGVLGAGMMVAIRSGVARGVFSNESGLGSAPIAAAAAKTRYAAEQGLVSMTGTFIDTIIICTMTGIVLVMTGVYNEGLQGAEMTNAAFSQQIPFVGQYIITIGLIFFAFTTILGWNYYGERCAYYLFGIKVILPYRIIYILIVALGASLKLDLIWIIADIVNGLMAIPNLIALIILSPVIVKETKKYLKKYSKQKLNVEERKG